GVRGEGAPTPGETRTESGAPATARPAREMPSIALGRVMNAKRGEPTARCPRPRTDETAVSFPVGAAHAAKGATSVPRQNAQQPRHCARRRLTRLAPAAATSDWRSAIVGWTTADTNRSLKSSRAIFRRVLPGTRGLLAGRVMA